MAPSPPPAPSRSPLPLGKRLLLAGLLMAVTIVWGWTFSLMKQPVETFGVVGFLAIRFAIATLALLLVNLHRLNGRTLGLGMGIGLTLGMGYLAQTIGLKYSLATNTAFITGLFIVFAPLGNRLLFGVRTPPALWAAVAVSLGGLALLSGFGTDGLQWGDLSTLLCAVMFGLQIALLDRHAAHHDVAVLTLGQILSAACLFAVLWPLTDCLAWPSRQVWFALLVTGLVATALAFCVQTFVQTRLSAIEVAIILLCEPLFAAVFAYLLRDERLTGLQWAGAALMFGSIVTVELYPRLNGNRRNRSQPPTDPR